MYFIFTFFLGNPLLDIAADVPQSMFEKYGLKHGDAILAEEKHMPIFKDLVDNYKVNYVAGGATQNTIRVAQWMLGDKAPCAYMVSRNSPRDYRFLFHAEKRVANCIHSVRSMFKQKKLK